MKCEMLHCDNEAEYYDGMSNKICEDCMIEEAKLEGNGFEDYEAIEFQN